MWTMFTDCHSGGGKKEAFDTLVIEADREEAGRIFFARFGHSPYRISCTCCGPDYGIESIDSIEEAYGEKIEYIYAADIKPAERTAEVPRQGYVWVG